MFKYNKVDNKDLIKLDRLINTQTKNIYGVVYNHEWSFYYKRENFVKNNLSLENAITEANERFLTQAIELKHLKEMNLVSVDIDNPFITFLLYANNFNFLISTPRIGHSNIILSVDKKFNENFIKHDYITATSKTEELKKFFLPDNKNRHRFFITFGENLSTVSNFQKVMTHYEKDLKNYLNVFELDFENIDQYKIL